ncbi:anti-sigma factor RsbA family regulatory protein [Streptomyces sp. NPDC008313]|uniref:anti-sigma factor RsbA family regulatory protein n=1 Tax=Streptomyces sp. NPDC008313 TaxID=3364826 RepID=UPI0036EC24CF
MTAREEQFVHPALFYRDEREYLAGTASFVREGLAAGEPVAVAVPPDNLRLLQAELGPEADGVRFLDMTREGRNPGQIIPGVLRAFADAQPAGRVRIIGEPIWAGRSAAEYPACVQHEALINAAFQDRPVTILCPYDVTGLDARVLDDAYATHPTVIDAGRESRSAAYSPEAVVDRYNEPLPVVPDAGVYVFDADSLPDARRFAVAHASAAGMSGRPLDDLALVTAELTTNSVVHGGGSGTLRVWSEERRVVVEVRDRGQLKDPLAGRRPPPRAQCGGRGLLLVNLLTDLVRLHTDPDGTTVRCYLGL